MKSARIAALALPLLVLAGCATDEAGALVACEQLVDQRVGAQLEHLGPLDGASAEQAGEQWVVTGGFTEPRGGGLTRYTCTVARDGDSWRLVDLATDR
mgnify:CR=1 FL=1